MENLCQVQSTVRINVPSAIDDFSLLFLFFLYHTVDALSGPDWTEALVVGNACRLSQVTGRPAVDQMRFPDEWPAHGDVIGIPLLHETFD